MRIHWIVVVLLLLITGVKGGWSLRNRESELDVSLALDDNLYHFGDFTNLSKLVNYLQIVWHIIETEGFSSKDCVRAQERSPLNLRQNFINSLKILSFYHRGFFQVLSMQEANSNYSPSYSAI